MITQDLLKKIDNFNAAIDYLRKSSIGTPKTLRIDLSVAHTDLEMNIAGNFFYVIESADEDHYVDIKFNEQREPAHRLYKMMGFYTPFYKFYVTNSAQPAGEMTIVYGTLSKDFVDIIDNRGATSADLSAIRDELRGDTAAEGYGRVAVGAAATQIVAANVDRKSVIIQHAVGGVGYIYLGYDNTVTNTNHFICLAPGEVWSTDDYRGAIYAIRSGGATNAQYGEQ